MQKKSENGFNMRTFNAKWSCPYKAKVGDGVFRSRSTTSLKNNKMIFQIGGHNMHSNTSESKTIKSMRQLLQK